MSCRLRKGERTFREERGCVGEWERKKREGWRFCMKQIERSKRERIGERGVDENNVCFRFLFLLKPSLAFDSN